MFFEPIDTYQIHQYAYEETLLPFLRPLDYKTVTNSLYQLYTKNPLLKINVSDVDQCVHLCNETYICRGYNYLNGSCILVDDDAFISPIEHFSDFVHLQYAYTRDTTPSLFSKPYVFVNNTSYVLSTALSDNKMLALNSSECMVACNNSYTCRGYNYYFSSSQCDLLSSLTSLTPVSTSNIASYAYIAPFSSSVRVQPYTVVHNTSYQLFQNNNNNVSYQSNTSLLCQSMCDATHGCLAYNYDNYKNCTLFTSAVSTYKPFNNTCSQTYAYLSSLQSPILQKKIYKNENSRFTFNTPINTINNVCTTQCQSVCDNTYDCIGFIMDHDTCTLLDSNIVIPSERTVQTAFTTNATLQRRNFNSISNTSYMFETSDTLAKLNMPNASACELACDSTYKCNAYNYTNDADSTCVLLNEVQYTVRTLSACGTYHIINTKKCLLFLHTIIQVLRIRHIY